jgi:hypothetical protein
MTRSRLFSSILGIIAATVAMPALADEYLVYTDAGIPGGGTDVWVWCDGQSPSNPCDFAQTGACDNPEGNIRFRYRTIGAWMGFGVFHNIVSGAPTPVDLSAYIGGDLRFFVKTPFDGKVEIQCQPGGVTQTKTILQAFGSHGWDGTNSWQEIVIPLEDFFAPQPVDAECLSTVLSPFMVTTDGLPVALNEWYFDNVKWQVSNAHAGPSNVQVQDRQLTVDGEPFVVNGIGYTPISIGEDWRGALRDRADRYSVDFPLIAASGANVVRTYSSFLTTAMLDAAWAEGLYVIPTFEVNTTQLTCPTGRSFMQDRFRDVVLQWKDHPAILAWLVGNEVNANLGSADLCTDWYPQLDAMALAAHQAEGATFHPVGTASAEIGDICTAGCSDDTALPNVDFWGAQIYRGCSFYTTFSDYGNKPDCARPLIITEFGSDAWDSQLGAESQSMQADCLESLLTEADQALAVNGTGGVSSGQVVFEWADEWWKAYPPDPPIDGYCTSTDWFVHDTCKNWESFGYPDPAMNEEWWGIASIDSADPNSRGLRTAYERIQAAWQRGLGAVCGLRVVGHDPGTGSTTLSFSPAAGATDHALYYGPMSSVSTYGYTGAENGLGMSGSSTVTLPAGDLFWVLAGQNDSGEEGCYGTSSADARPCYPAEGSCDLPQAASQVCECSVP